MYKLVLYSQMVKSLKDLKIMSRIIEDAKIPLSSLAKRVRLAREVVQYRLKNLEENLIAGYQARINLYFVSESIYTIYLNIPGMEREDIIKRLRKLPRVHWIGSTVGRWNYILTFSINAENSLSNFLDELSKQFSIPIRYSLTQQIEEFKDTFGGLFNNDMLLTSQKPIKKIRIDETDRKILENLTKNARISNSEIADKINMTREAVRRRIKILEKAQIILNYRTLIKPQALDLESFVLTIKCFSTNSKELSKICSFLCLNKSFSYLCTTAGEFSILSVVHLKSLKELDALCTKLRSEFSKLILEIESLPLVGVISQDYFS